MLTRIIDVACRISPNLKRSLVRMWYQYLTVLDKEALVIYLISGGASAMLEVPCQEEISVEDMADTYRVLVHSNAPIKDINAIRKHLSAIKGGRLAAAAYPAQLLPLVISDVPGDDPALIASGPTVADPSSFEDARAVLKKYGITEPKAVIDHLDRAADETPKPGDRRLRNAEYPDGGSSAEIYTNPDPLPYVELEMLSPLATMKRGAVIEWANTYTLLHRSLSTPEAEALAIYER